MNHLQDFFFFFLFTPLCFQRFDFLLHQGNAFPLLLMFLCLWPETRINCLVLWDSLLTLKWAFCPLKWQQYEIEAIWSWEPWSFCRGTTTLLGSLEMIGPTAQKGQAELGKYGSLIYGCLSLYLRKRSGWCGTAFSLPDSWVWARFHFIKWTW